MFKRGGDVIDSQGSGITSGLDTPRSNYFGGGTIGGGTIHGNPIGNRTGFKGPQINKEQLDNDTRKAIRNTEVTSEQYSSNALDAFASGFLNPKARTMGEALFYTNEARKSGIKPLEERAAERQFQLDKGGIEKAYDRETAEIITKLESENDVKVAEIQASSTATAQRIKQLNLQFTKNGVVDRSNPEYQRNLNEIVRGFSKTESANKLMIAILNSQMANNEKEAMKMAIRMILGTEAALLGNAYGGKPRSRYQLGTTNQGVQPIQASLNVDETIKTPTETIQEDVSVQEKPQSSIGIPYEQFRAKMPAEVDDEIVQLIYYNEDAFADFAQITSQADVYAFNNKWGVSLVLPMDTEIA